MHNNSSGNDLELSRFGTYLLKSRIIVEKYATYYVRWVRKFMAEVPDRAGITFEDRLSVFLDNLRPSISACCP